MEKMFSWGNVFLGGSLHNTFRVGKVMWKQIIFHILNLPLKGSVLFLFLSAYSDHQNKNFCGQSCNSWVIHVVYYFKLFIMWTLISILIHFLHSSMQELEFFWRWNLFYCLSVTFECNRNISILTLKTWP